MAKNTRHAAKNAKTDDHPRPEVIVDFVFDKGLLFVGVSNIGTRPALNVIVRFDKTIHALGGGRILGSLGLFNKLLFLAPQKQIMTLLDSSAAYFKRREPTNITAHISYRDDHAVHYTSIIRHNLDIYRDISYIPHTT